MIRIKCKDCKTFGKEFETSPVRPTKTGKSYDVNRRMAYASVVMGESRNGMQQFCGIMGMPPPPNEKSWRLHLKNLGETVKQTAENSMQVSLPYL